MSRLQDSVIDDDEETCPLCIEEFDLSDRNFRPCPCGYQICQFCFNSLKNTYDKSTCPNCRRPYDEKTIQYKIPTADEFKADQQNKSKKQAAARRKETEKKEVETSSRRNLAGVRVKQQNLVYVIGLLPQIKDESTLLQTLRGPDYFGQYGDIDKIVVSKAKPGSTNQGIGVYVTYARREDAALCISTVDGSVNGDRVLRAQFGTTKYCSAYLRGDVCTNKSCSFLHETGEDGHNSSLQGEPHAPKPIAKPVTGSITVAPPTRPLSTSSQPMVREESKESDSRKGSTDGSALPSTASWAHTPAFGKVRRPSATSGATLSPQLSHADLAPQSKLESKLKDSIEVVEPKIAESSRSTSKTIPSEAALTPSKISADPVQGVFDHVLKNVSSRQYQFNFSDACLNAEQKDFVEHLPPMIDPYGGAKRRVMQDKDTAERALLESDVKDKLEAQATSAAEEALDDGMGAGSLALGGEPEDNPRSASARGAISRPGFMADQFADMTLNTRSLTPQQRQQLGLNSAPGLQPPAGSTAFELANFDDRRTPQYSQAQYDQISNHQRHGSRYFNSDTKTATPTSRFQGQQQPFYSSGIQGPPPGLPASGTPPVSGGGMFAHGQNFTNPGFGAAKDNNTDINMRGRSGTNDVSKRGVEHLADPSIVQARLHQSGSTGQGLYGGNQVDEQNFPPLPTISEAQRSNLHSRVSSFQSLAASSGRSSTPKVPPGFETSHAHSQADAAAEAGTIGTRPAAQRTVSAAVPVALPNLPLMQRSSTPKPKPDASSEETEREDVELLAEHQDKGKGKAREISLGSPKPRATRQMSQQIIAEGAANDKESPEIAKVVPVKSSEAKTKIKQKVSKPDKIELPATIAPAAAKAAEPLTTSEKVAAPMLAESSVVATPPLMSPQPTTPTTAASEISRSSAARPRTLRVTTAATAKQTDTAPPSATTERSVPLPFPTPGHVSRQGSVSSAQRMDSLSQSQSRPSTPAMSERLQSEVASRASSPPPSIVGSAVERTKSKAHTKKERKEKSKASKSSEVGAEASSAAQTPPAEEVGPIVARQKKQKRKPDKSQILDDEPTQKPVQTKRAIEDKPASKTPSAPSTPTPSTPHEPPLEPTDDDKPPYTLGDLFTDASRLPSDTSNPIQHLLNEHVSSAPKILSSLIASGDLSRDHPFLNPVPFTSSAYKLHGDSRKGQDYLDAHGYTPTSAFGYVYLPSKERKALERGSAVGVVGALPSEPVNSRNGKGSNSATQKEDLLRKCLITPNGVVYRHLSAEESDKVLELEERRSIYIEELGEDVGGMHGLEEKLEMDDFINLTGGIEELGRKGEAHGVVWVHDSDERDEGVWEEDEQGSEGEDNDEDEDELGDFEDNEGFQGGYANTSMSGYEADKQARNKVELAAMRGEGVSGVKSVNLRQLDVEILQKRLQEKQKEWEVSRKEMERVEKMMAKRSREMGKAREGVLRAVRGERVAA